MKDCLFFCLSSWCLFEIAKCKILLNKIKRQLNLKLGPCYQRGVKRHRKSNGFEVSLVTEMCEFFYKKMEDFSKINTKKQFWASNHYCF